MLLPSFLLSLVILAFLICVVNLAFVLLVYHRVAAKSLQRTLLLSLGCSDFCAGFLAIPSTVLCNLADSSLGCPVCMTSYLLTQFIAVSSALHLLAVVYERYLKIIYPFWFQSHEFSLLRSTRVIPSLWLTSLVISAIPLTWLLLGTPCYDERSDRLTRYYNNACLAFFLLLVLFMIYAFLRIFLVVRTHLQEIRATLVTAPCASVEALDTERHQVLTTEGGTEKLCERSSQVHDTQMNMTARDAHSDNLFPKPRRYWLMKEARVISRFGAMVMMFALVWGTYFFFSTQEQKGNEVSPLAQKIVISIRFLNPLLDPWILTVNNKDFQGTWGPFSLCYSRMVAFFRRQTSRRHFNMTPSGERSEPTVIYTSNV